MHDKFSSYYAELLYGSYDCVDRIVLNAYFPLGMTAGGFRTWWRRIMDDTKLDNTHLIRFAGRFSRRIHAAAQNNNIPLIHCKPGERKHKIAVPLIPADPEFRGVFCILAGRAQAPIYEVKQFDNGAIDIRRKIPYPYVNHYSFHIMDDDWGHIIIKLCPHPPFTAQIILNGHEYVERQARKRGVVFGKEGNCFTSVSNACDLAGIADTMRAQCAEGQLVQVCERWIYSACLCYALDIDQQRQSHFHYRYSVYQAEYSRNLFFQQGNWLDKVFNGTIDRTRSLLNIKTVRTIFGHKNRPCRKQILSEQQRFEVAVEKPVYDLTVFKINHKRLTVKMYSKGARVLRIEAVAHNTADLRVGKLVDKFAEITDALKQIVERFLSALHGVDISFVTCSCLEQWPLPSQIGAGRVAGLDVSSPRTRAVMKAVIALSSGFTNFTSADVADKVRELHDNRKIQYTPRQAAYDLKKFRAKGLINLPTKRGRSYKATTEGIKQMTAFIVLRDKVIFPLLNNAGKRKTGTKRHNIIPIDRHYKNIQTEMQSIFRYLKIAA